MGRIGYMESLLANLPQFWMSTSFNFIFLISLLLILFVGIHFYSLSRGKKELLKVVDSKVKVFKNFFIRNKGHFSTFS